MTSARKAGRRSLLQLFGWPLLIALFSLFGLVAALTGDGLRDCLSWAGLAVPVAVACWAWRQRH